MRILVAFGSKHGGTEGLALAVAEALGQSGHEVLVTSASKIDGLESWDVVVVGGALYAGHWQREARRFVRRHVEELRQLPVWFFSSGPLDDSAKNGSIGPTPSVQKLMALVHARGHVTFGGRLESDVKGFIASSMAKHGRSGDWRDMESATEWAKTIANELSRIAPKRPVALASDHARRFARRCLGALCLFSGLTALAGGAELIGWPNGSPALKLDTSVLQHSPFSDFRVPGLLLAGVVGLSNLVAGVLALRRQRWSPLVAFASGSALAVWIVTEVAMLRTTHWLHGLYLAIGLTTMSLALWLWVRRPGARKPPRAEEGPIRGRLLEQ
jgi:menaquinone-dependent protoporphyrinogen oxidase